jgi:lysophospholipase L1-like esterase
MQMSIEQTRWLLKVLQPERTLGSLAGAAVLSEGIRAALLGIAPDVYAAEHARMLGEAKEAARQLLADPAVAAMVDRLPLKENARIVAFGDSHTSDPQSWAVILNDLLAARGSSVSISAVAGDTTTHGLVRMGEVVARQPDWILFLIGMNDARTQGPNPTKTLVDHSETARNLRELYQRATHETKARCLLITPPPVIEDRVSTHWGLSRFGVRFRNEDISRVADAVRDLGAPTVDLFAALGAHPPTELLMDDGLHFTLAGQKRLALEVVRGWSVLS